MNQDFQHAANAIRSIVNEIASSSRFYLPLHVRPEIYYSDSGEPGMAIDASGILSAYVGAYGGDGKQFDVSVKDCGTGTEAGKIFSSRSDAVEWAIDELLYRGAHKALTAPRSERPTVEIPAVTIQDLADAKLRELGLLPALEA